MNYTSDDDDCIFQSKMEDEGEDPHAALTNQTLNADGTPKRPMNAFMIFARRRRPQVSAENQAMRTGDISKILSQEWKAMAPADKQFYLGQAKQLKETFNAKYPDYVYRRRPNNTRRRRPKEAGTPGARDTDGESSSPDAEDPPTLPDNTHPHAHPVARYPPYPVASASSSASYGYGAGYGHARTASYPYPGAAYDTPSSPYNYAPYDAPGPGPVPALRKAQSIPAMSMPLSPPPAAWPAPAPSSNNPNYYPASAQHSYGEYAPSGRERSGSSASPRYSPYASPAPIPSTYSPGPSYPSTNSYSPVPAHASPAGHAYSSSSSSSSSYSSGYGAGYAAPRALAGLGAGGGDGGGGGGGAAEYARYWGAEKML
ncbi:hypothetical protein DFH07DRAFT_770860 [Mycena maculata]|uniref:HMG box domain-containing protein n=1 Tax=Mycena maculata TaxID=230809 RepID=A0AAD7JEG2_9AGAR|nr:hypothetical protein DFH07DRAFT_770860 [Mycena maculata]